MRHTKFIVKVNRADTLGPVYVQRLDRTTMQTTPTRKLALEMGKFTAEDAVKAIQTHDVARAGFPYCIRLSRAAIPPLRV